jgi:FkbM family methyltransferase
VQPGVYASTAIDRGVPEISRGGSMQLHQLELTYGEGRRTFYYREQSPGDVGVVRQVFTEQQYNLGAGVHVTALNIHARKLGALGKTPIILDFGANIGASAVYWAAVYPAARVVAIEPHPANFHILTLNTEGLAVTAIEAAIACSGGIVNLTDPGAGDWGFRTSSSATNCSFPVAATTPTEVMAPFATDHSPLICKIDIEGAEADLFTGVNAWANTFPMIVIELHDWMLPGARSSRSFLTWLTQGDFEVLQRGENLFCFNLSILAASIKEALGARRDVRTS